MRDGAVNMAIDEALLQRIGNGETPPVIRLYGFSPPTLSLGAFQRIRNKLLLPKLREDGVTYVRRPTGGQAVLHDNELTYAVILSRDHFEHLKKREIYKFSAGLLLEGLKNLGIRGISVRQRRGNLYNPDCFRSTGEYEISGQAGKKLIGSAQIMTRNGSLQHGSFPLDDSYQRISLYLSGNDGFVVSSDLSRVVSSDLSRVVSSDLSRAKAGTGHPEPGCLDKEPGKSVSFAEAVTAFSRGFQTLLYTENTDLSPDERLLADQLYHRKYSEETWNLKY